MISGRKGEASRMPTDIPPRRLRLPRKLVMSLLPLVVLVIMLELAMWVIGLGGSENGPSTSRGFDPATAYFVPHQGGWRTRLYGKHERELVVPPKGAARRIVMVGGSNTEVFPDEYLQQLLCDREDAPAGYEVINLGRKGFGSGRVAILMVQALALEPDVIVIYSGHNEFVERGMAAELERALGGKAGRVATEGLSRLRLYRQLEQALRGSSSPGSAGGDVDPTAVATTWSTTLAVYDGYRRNLTRMLDAARDAGVAVVLCSVVSNHLSPPFASDLPPELETAAAERFEVLRGQAVRRIPPRFLLGLHPPLRLRMASWTTGKGASPSEGLPELRSLDGPLADAPATPPERLDDASMEGRHWPPPEGWAQGVSKVLSTMESFSRREVSEVERTALERAEVLLGSALDIVQDNADALFDLGLVTWLLGQDDVAAQQLLVRAAAADLSPHSGNEFSNAIVHAVVEGRDGVEFLDAAALFAARCPDGIVGYEVMMDACHMHPGARRVFMVDMAAAIGRALDR